MKPKEPSRKVGLARALSKLGYCSRSQAAELIRSGRVRWNGSLVRDPEAPVRVGKDHIAIDDRALEAAKKIYLMMNKPRGLVTTACDEQGRETIYAVLATAAEPLPWVAPVGRLDKASEGLLLLTNDSEWGARIAAPEAHVQKTYHVQIGALVDAKFADGLVSGVKNGDDDDDRLRATSARLLRSGKKNCWLEIVLDEGKNRQIRRMLAALQVEVIRLVRVAIGPLPLGELAKGTFRVLREEEKQGLDRAARQKVS